MCGLAGKLNFDAHEPADPALVARMTARLAHRGPDGEGRFVRGPVALGHRRLAIIDLAGSPQPMGNEDGSIQVVFNGEIYNFAELRRTLVARGHTLASAGDTEVIVHLYEDHGDACVEHLRGMFAFALWDGRRRRLLLARDRVGIKPLYYHVTPGRAIVFASEIKALLADPAVQARVDLGAIDRFLAHHYVPGERTPIEGVLKLRPGHLLTVEGGRVAVREYWRLPPRPQGEPPAFDAAARRVGELLDDSVREHLASDVPLGVLLSGGVDSSAVLGYAARHAAEPLHTFTVGFDGGGIVDERPYARLASGAHGTQHHEATFGANDFRDLLPHYVWHMEEPVCEPPAIALYVVAALARRCGVRVLLSGEGGDEAFAGYPEYRNLVALEGLKRGLGPGPVGLAFGALQRLGWARGAHYAELAGRPLQDYYLSRTATPGSPFNRLRASLWRDGCGGSDRDAWSPIREAPHQPDARDPLARMLDIDLRSWLPDDLLLKADKMTMAASVELRVPLLDHRLLEYAASLPAHYKVRGTQLKRVLRTAVRSVVPSAILGRRKAGFPVPYRRWLRHELRDHVADTVLARDSFASRYFERPVVERLLQGEGGGEDAGKEAFSLLVLELWHRQFVRGHDADRPRADREPALAAT